MHNVFYDPTSMDLEVIKAEADKRQRGAKFVKPEGTIIHYHKIEEACDPTPSEMNDRHEFYWEDKHTVGPACTDGTCNC